MKIIHKNIALFDEVIGKQNISVDNEMRPMNFVTSCKVNEGLLLYNVLTRELIFLAKGENQEDKRISEYLKQHWFFVPKDFDEIEFENQIKSFNRLFPIKDAVISNFTVFTTLRCNARCYYCFEKGSKQSSMTLETAIKVANYMISSANGKKISVHWFGGEPLYNKDAIVIICKIFREKGIDFTSRIISNGYLFDELTVKEAINDWKLSFVQITIDGTSNIYNRSKAYIYKDDPNPFETVLSNIQHLLDYNVQVSIRLNVSKNNGDDLLKLVDLLHNRFGENKNLTIYSHSLFEYSGNAIFKYTEETRHKLCLKRKEIEERIDSYHLNKKRNKMIGDTLKLNCCMSDSDTSLTILPDGQFGKCEHYTDDHFVGNINSSEWNHKMLQEHKEVLPDLVECKTCAYHPDCIRLKVCKEKQACFPEIRDENIGKLHKSMIYTYENYLKNKDKVEILEDEIEIQC